VDVLSVITRKKVKIRHRKGKQDLPPPQIKGGGGGTSETSTQGLQHFDSSAVQNKIAERHSPVPGGQQILCASALQCAYSASEGCKRTVRVKAVNVDNSLASKQDTRA
jgi:hypothetical protein